VYQFVADAKGSCDQSTGLVSGDRVGAAFLSSVATASNKRKPVWGSSFSRALFGLAKYAFVLRAEANAIAAGIQNVSKQRFKVHLSAQHFGRLRLKHRKKLSVAFLVRAFSHRSQCNPVEWRESSLTGISDLDNAIRQWIAERSIQRHGCYLCQLWPSLKCASRCAYSKLESDVLMMEPAEDWNRCDAAYLLDPAKIRSIFLQ
jgi:hypothetical protein